MSQTQQEYKKWLQWFINNGGKPTHYYDYPFSNRDFILATQGGRYLGGYGSESINLLVPEHVTNFTVDDKGHSNIYQYDMEKMKNVTFIPQFQDLCLDYKAREDELKKDMEWEERQKEYERQHDEREQRLKQYDNLKCEFYVEKERKEKELKKRRKERERDLEEKRADYKAEQERKARMIEYNDKKANEGWLQLIGIGLFFIMLISWVMSTP